MDRDTHRRRTVNDRIATEMAGADPFDLGNIYRPEDVLPQDVAERARHVRAFSGDYTREFILQTLHRLLLARVPLDQIARRFGVTVRTVQNWRGELHRIVAEEARKLDPYPIIGEAMAHYRMVRGDAHQRALAARNMAEWKAAMEIALKAEGEFFKLMQVSGGFERNLMREGMDAKVAERTQAENNGGAVGLKGMAEAWLKLASGDTIIDEDEEEGTETDGMPLLIEGEVDYGPKLF